MTTISAAGAAAEPQGVAGAGDAQQPSRSAQLLAAGRLALERGDLDAVDRYLVQLSHEGHEADYRELANAVLMELSR